MSRLCLLVLSAMMTSAVLAHDVTPQPELLVNHKMKKSNEVRDILYLNAKFDRALNKMQQEDFAEAVLILDEYLEESREVLGSDNFDRMMAMDTKAVCLRHLNRLDEALSLQNHVLEVLNQTLGNNNHPALLNVYNNKAVTLTKLGRYEEALQNINYVIGRRVEVDDESILDGISDLHNKAYILSMLGRYVESNKIFDEVIEKRIEILGSDNKVTLRSMQYKAENLEKMGEKWEALDMYQDILEKRKRVLGDNHVDTKHTAKCVTDLRADLNLVR